MHKWWDEIEIFGFTLYRLKRVLKYWLQRRIRGWDDTEIWSLDYTLAKWIIPRLERFKEIHPSIVHLSEFEKTEKEWILIINKMIRAFTLITYETDRYVLNDKEWKEINEGLDLFRKYFINLWPH